MIKRSRSHQPRDTATSLSKSSDKPQQVRRLLSVQEDASAVMWNRPDSQIIYGRQVEKGYDRAKIEADGETETKKLHRYVGQLRSASRPDSVAIQSPAKAAAAAAPLTKTNATEVKPTFEEFLEFVLDTDLLGTFYYKPVKHGLVILHSTHLGCRANINCNLVEFYLFFLVKGIGYDSHWVPFHRYCSPCSGRFKKIHTYLNYRIYNIRQCNIRHTILDKANLEEFIILIMFWVIVG